MPWTEFEPTISAGERPKTYALDRTATGTGACQVICELIYFTLRYSLNIFSVVTWRRIKQEGYAENSAEPSQENKHL